MENNKTKFGYTVLELLQTVQQQKNTTVLRDYLDSKDGSIDLVLTQLVLNMQQHFSKICPNDRGLDHSFKMLLEVLNCLFYGDPNAKNEIEHTIPDEYNLTKEDVLIRYFKLVMASPQTGPSCDRVASAVVLTSLSRFFVANAAKRPDAVRLLQRREGEAPIGSM